MVIKTKFDIGESAFIIYGSGVEKITIDEISFHKNAKGMQTVKYKTYDHEGFVFPEYNAFKTKEELLKSL